jgi:O-antigen/teichoic acid export membrane protein
MLFALGTVAVAYAPLDQLLGVQGNKGLVEEGRSMTILAGCAFVATFMLSGAPALWSGLQEGYWTSIASMLGTGLSLICLCCVYLARGGVVAFTSAMVFPPLVTTSVLAVWLFSGRHAPFRPTVSAFQSSCLYALMRSGRDFLCITAGDVAIIYSANILIAAHFGATAVAEYAVPYAIFTVIASLAGSAVPPLWPAYADARSRGDIDWIRRTARGSVLRSTLLTALGSLAFVAVAKPLLAIWTGNRCFPPSRLLVAMSLYFILISAAYALGILANGIGLRRLRAGARLGVGLAQIAGFFLLYEWVGVLALPIAGSLALFVEIAIYAYYIRRDLRREQQRRATLASDCLY